MLAWQQADQGHGPGVGNCQSKSQRFFGQRLGRGRHFVEQLLTRQLGQYVTHDSLTADDHVQCRFNAEYTRQPLCAACSRYQAQLDLRQGNTAARRCDAVMTAQGKFQTTAHADGMDRCDHRLGRIFERQNHAEQIRFCQCFRTAKFLDVGTT